MQPDQNPYRSPRHTGNELPVAPTNRRRKPLWMYPVAALIGAIIGAAVLAGPLAVLDDAGGLQMAIGGLLGVVVYRFLF